MALFTIRNDCLTVTVASRAAELQSIRGSDGTEYLWQGDAAYWSDRAPTLFPHIARLRDGAYPLDGQTWQMPIHGIAPYSDFTAVPRTAPDSLTLTLSDTPETLRQYPRRFGFAVTFRLVGNRLEVIYTVENRDERPLYFGVGGHPGFRVPLQEGLSFSDYRLRFGAPCQPRRVLFSDALLVTGETAPYSLTDNDTLPLDHGLFSEDAIVLQDVSRTVTLKSDRDAHGLTLDFPDFPYLGIWHMPDTDAPYVCLEPWSSLPAPAHGSDDFAARPDLLCLAPAQTRTLCWTVTFR